MKCPACGFARMDRDTRDIEHVYKGEMTVIPAVTGDFCPSCLECVTDAEESARVMQAIRDFAGHAPGSR